MESVDYLRFIGGLVLVIGLILALTWGIRRYGPHALGGASGGKRRLALVESLTLDAKHRLVLIREGDREHLLVLGGQGLVVQTNLETPKKEGDAG